MCSIKDFRGIKILTKQGAFTALLASLDNFTIQEWPPETLEGRHLGLLSRAGAVKASKYSLSEKKLGYGQFIINNYTVIDHNCFGPELGHIRSKLIKRCDVPVDDSSFHRAQKAVLLRKFCQEIRIKKARWPHNFFLRGRKKRFAAIYSKNSNSCGSFGLSGFDRGHRLIASSNCVWPFFRDVVLVATKRFLAARSRVRLRWRICSVWRFGSAVEISLADAGLIDGSLMSWLEMVPQMWAEELVRLSRLVKAGSRVELKKNLSQY